MNNDVIRIGGASGYWGDYSRSTAELLAAGGLDYLVYDYLAEVTMSIMARARAKDSEAGYAKDFVRQTVGRRLIQFYQRPLIETSTQSHAQLKSFVQAQDGLRGISINDYLPNYRNFLD